MSDIFEIIYRTSATEGSPGTAPPPGGSGGLTQPEADARYARRSLNLSDLNSASSARSNLGLGALAVLNQVDTPQIVDNAVTLDKAVFADQNLLTTSHVTFASVTAGYLRTVDGNIRSDETAITFTNVTGFERVSIAALNADLTGNLEVHGNIKFHGKIESESFAEAAGLIDGFQVTQPGDLKAKSIRANELRVKAFVAEVSAALYGEDILTKSRGVLSRDFTVPIMEGTATLFVEDLEGLPDMGVFEDNDFVRLRIIDRSGGGLIVADVWGQVSNYQDLSGGEQSWVFERLSGGETGDVVHAGSIAIDYGQSGDSVMVRSVIGDYTPRDTQLFWVTNPWTAGNYTIISRVGNLGGIPNTSGSGFYGENVFLTGGVLIGDLTKVGSYISYADDDLEIYVKTFTLTTDYFTIDNDGYVMKSGLNIDPAPASSTIRWLRHTGPPAQISGIDPLVVGDPAQAADLRYAARSHSFRHRDENGDTTIFLVLEDRIIMNLNALPTSDPEESGALYRDGTNLRVSTG